MRRAVPVIAATAGALALLANFHTSQGKATLATGRPAGVRATSVPSPPTTSASTAGSTPGSTTSAAADRTVDGPPVSNRYGVVRVRVVLRGSQIVDVQTLQMPFDRDRSQRISDEAAPLLRSEALQAQSANIDLLSGATYTSDSYARSLQGALDRARG